MRLAANRGVRGALGAAVALALVAGATFSVGEVCAQWSHQYQRPGADGRLPEPIRLAELPAMPRQLLWHAGAWHLLTADGTVLRLGEGGFESRHDGLPANALLVQSGEVLLAWTAEGIWRLGAEGLVPIVEPGAGVRGVTALDGDLYWFDDADGGSFYRRPVADGPIETLAKGIGAGNAFWPHGGGFFIGMAGDEPRGIYYLPAAGAALEPRVESRLVTREFLEIDGTLFVLMRNGTGFIKRFDPEVPSLTQLNLAPSGSAAMTRVGDRIYWHTDYGIFALRLSDFEPEEVAMATRPVGMVIRDSLITWADSHRRALLQLPVP